MFDSFYYLIPTIDVDPETLLLLFSGLQFHPSAVHLVPSQSTVIRHLPHFVCNLAFYGNFIGIIHL